MAMSKASTVKYAKALGTYSESELSEALEQIDTDEVSRLYTLMRKLYNKVKNVHIETVDGKNAPKKRLTTISAQEKLHRMIRIIESNLNKYESTDEIDSWDVSFNVSENFDGKTFAEIKEIHSKLIAVGSNIDKLRLLNFVERGRLYSFLKNSDERHESWTNVCVELNVCKRTVDRYIDFFKIICSYPRLLICELSFELIMTSYQQLCEYFVDNPSLDLRLRTPLKQTKLAGGVFSSKKMPGGSNEYQNENEEPSFQSEKYTWEPEWPFTDELFDATLP